MLSFPRSLAVVCLACLPLFHPAAATAQPFTYHQTLTAAAGGTGFGYSTDVDGDTVVIGAPREDGNRGAAYVFVKTGAGWVLQQQLVPNDRRVTAYFGWSVAISGSTVVVGSRGSNDGASGTGTAYVFDRSGTTWTQQAKLLPNGGDYNAAFGWSVAIDGNTIAIGAQFSDIYKQAAGAAYVFERSGTTWTQQALVPTVTTAGGRYGWSVDVSGDTICVGANEEDNGGFSATGAVYMFTRGLLRGTWTEQQRLLSPAPARLNRFGASCAVDGDTVAVGSVGANIEGLAHIYTRSGSSWSLQQTLTPANRTGLEWFGQSVGLRGNVVVVGAHLTDVGAVTNAGAAFVFTRTGTQWTERQSTPLPMSSANAELGNGVATDGVTVFAGAPTNLTTGVGAVAVYGTGSAPTSGVPGAPTNVTATATGSTLTMRWSPPSTGGAPTSYSLVARVAPGAAPLAVVPLGNVTSFATGAPNGTFVLSLTATNAAGTGPESAAVTVTLPGTVTPPASPTGLGASVSGTTATLTWTAPLSGGAVAGYVLLAGVTPAFTTPVASLPLPVSTALVIPGVPPGTYYLRLVAQNAGGTSAASNEVSITVAGPTAPSAPTMNPGTASSGTVTLSWTPGAGSPTSYTLRAFSGAGALLTTVPGLTVTSVSFGGVPAGTYQLDVQAVNAAGASAPSNRITLVVP